MPQGRHYRRRRLAGPKSQKQMRYHFSWSSSPSHADLMFMDLPMTHASPADFQSDRRHTETDSTLRLSGAGHSKSTWGTFDTNKWPYGCDGIRSCGAVAIASGTVCCWNIQRRADTEASKAGRHPSKQGRPAPKAGKQAPKAGRQAPKAGRRSRPAGRQRQTSMSRKKTTPRHQHTHTPAHPDIRTPVRMPTRAPRLVVSNLRN